MTKIKLDILEQDKYKPAEEGFENLSIIRPNAPSDEAQKLINTIGLEAYHALLTVEYIKHEIKITESRGAHVIFQLIRGLLSAFITENPNHMHFAVIKAAMEELNTEWHSDTSIRDMAARELINYCKKIKTKLIAPTPVRDALDSIKKACDEEAIINGYDEKPLLEVYRLPEQLNDLDNLFEKNRMFIWDDVFLNTLKLTGKCGRESAKEGLLSCQNRLRNAQNGTQDPFKFWFDPEYLHLSHALKILAKAVILDIVKKRIQFKQENVPALTTNIHAPIKRLLSPHNEVIENNDNIQIFNNEALVGNVLIPAIPQQIMSTVFSGIKKLNTVAGHRITRFLVLNAYDRKIEGQCDFRVIKLERGATELAERLGLNSNKAVTNIKEIIHAMAYFEFRSHYLTGNLIQLSKYKSSITHRQEAYEITIGTPLLPYQTFEDGGLLIPLLQDPPLVNPNLSHAGQYLLQMEVM
jgi:hypothetical protein